MSFWRQTIRTGNYEADQHMVETARAHAASQGLALRVMPMQGGGFEVEAVHPSSPNAPPPGPVPAVAMQVAAPAVVPRVAAPALSPDQCQTCGRRAPTKQVTFMQNVGCLIIRFPKTLRGRLCRTCISTYFWRYTLITFFFGWWGVISFFYSLVSIPQNIATFLSARSLPREF
jgi:hypothetical protein